MQFQHHVIGLCTKHASEFTAVKRLENCALVQIYNQLLDMIYPSGSIFKDFLFDLSFLDYDSTLTNHVLKSA